MILRLIAGAMALVFFAMPAQARHAPKHHNPVFIERAPVRCDDRYPRTCDVRGWRESRNRGHAVKSPGPRPRAWCGWFARQLVGQDPGPAYNLARNWAHWGHPSSPGVGVMVVWPHHVGMITGQASTGEWIVKSGNDGNQVRERARSLRGAIAFRAS